MVLFLRGPRQLLLLLQLEPPVLTWALGQPLAGLAATDAGVAQSYKWLK